jgi:hypothetical protein
MSNKNLLRKKFNNMYGKDKPLNSNTSMNNIMKNISPNNINYNTNSYSYDSSIEKNNSLNLNSSSSSGGIIGQIIFVVFILVIFAILYFFREVINKNLKLLWDKFYNSNSKLEEQVSQLMKDNEIKKEEELKKKKQEEELLKEKSQIEQEKENEKNKELEKKGGLNQLNEKVNMSNYRKDQIATSNGFCYIGYDLGQRECADIYAGEVCMSGQIFPTMDVCVNPKFRT